MLSSLQDSISGHKGTIEVTIKRHISISFTAGDISVVMPSPSNHPPPTRNVVPLGRAVAIPLGCGGSQAPHRVEIVPLFLEAFFTSSQVLRHSSGTSMLLSTGSTTSPGCSNISPDIRGYLQERLLWRPGVHLVTFLDLWLDGHWLPRRLLISLVLAHFARWNPREAGTPERLQYLRYMLLWVHFTLVSQQYLLKGSAQTISSRQGRSPQPDWRLPRSLPPRLPTILALCSHDLIKLEYWAHVR